MKIAIIGSGNMGSAVAAGIATGLPDVSITISNPSTGKLQNIPRDFHRL